MQRFILVLLACLANGGPVSASDVSVMSASEAMRLPQTEADARLPYAEHELAFGDLRLPEGDGPHPVVIVIHGGCWLAAYDLGHISSLAAAITAEGFATWSIEYRRIGDEGGGWPGTFVDVAAAADHLGVLGGDYPLDLDRVVVVGHSAGGHLALWLAARHKLAADDPLRGSAALPVDGVLSLAGITDLASYASPTGCGASVPGLLGGDPQDHADRLRALLTDRAPAPRRTADSDDRRARHHRARRVRQQLRRRRQG